MKIWEYQSPMKQNEKEWCQRHIRVTFAQPNFLVEHYLDEILGKWCILKYIEIILLTRNYTPHHQQNKQHCLYVCTLRNGQFASPKPVPHPIPGRICILTFHTPGPMTAMRLIFNPSVVGGPRTGSLLKISQASRNSRLWYPETQKQRDEDKKAQFILLGQRREWRAAKAGSGLVWTLMGQIIVATKYGAVGSEEEWAQLHKRAEGSGENFSAIFTHHGIVETSQASSWSRGVNAADAAALSRFRALNGCRSIWPPSTRLLSVPVRVIADRLAHLPSSLNWSVPKRGHSFSSKSQPTSPILQLNLTHQRISSVGRIEDLFRHRSTASIQGPLISSVFRSPERSFTSVTVLWGVCRLDSIVACRRPPCPKLTSLGLRKSG